MSQPVPPPSAGAQQVCARHPDRATGLSCTRCGRPACPECLREASVGFQCVDCVGRTARQGRRGTTVAGAEPGSRPVVVPTLIAINVAVFVWTVVQAGSIQDNWRSAVFQETALVPTLVAYGDWWRLVTSGFLHIGPIHLLANMLALWMLGRDVELVLGRGRFLALYVISLLGGSAAVMLFSGALQPVAGASGAVFGLMGGLVVVLRRMRLPLSQALVVIGVNVAISFVVPNISIAGHAGGLVTGAAVTAALVFAPPRNRGVVQVGALVGIVVVILALIAIAAAQLF
ncbi:rhomboid family intramembrane serine protease [Pseudonocardia sp. TRM90224]|uniref:rhomboid family intramembrane serine protease n=1 Tax=Pseudonocardia sp. TRM90224 TaxID=2812678 RepID=UPI001E3279CD|nr:rhomboid family intramembrane serine protease [Pseudonocardia sp. TRM90224]